MTALFIVGAVGWLALGAIAIPLSAPLALAAIAFGVLYLVLAVAFSE